MSTFISTNEMNSGSLGQSNSPSGAPILKLVASSVGALIGGIKRYLECRSASARLASLDDRLLQDIGISRDEIDLQVYGRARQTERRVIPQWPVI